MVNQDDSFIREVNDELRSDQMRLVWKRFGRILIGAAVLVVLGTIGKVSYEYWRDREASAAGDSAWTTTSRAETSLEARRERCTASCPVHMTLHPDVEQVFTFIWQD